MFPCWFRWYSFVAVCWVLVKYLDCLIVGSRRWLIGRSLNKVWNFRLTQFIWLEKRLSYLSVMVFMCVSFLSISSIFPAAVFWKSSMIPSSLLEVFCTSSSISRLNLLSSSIERKCSCSFSLSREIRFSKARRGLLRVSHSLVGGGRGIVGVNVSTSILICVGFMISMVRPRVPPSSELGGSVSVSEIICRISLISS